MATLPGGRINKTGPDAWSVQMESYETRLQRIPTEQEWVWTPSIQAITGVVLADNRVYFATMPPLVGVFKTGRIQLFVAVAGIAGEQLRTAIYKWDNDTLFHKVPRSDAIVSLAATGLATTSFGPVTLYPGHRYAVITKAEVPVSAGAIQLSYVGVYRAGIFGYRGDAAAGIVENIVDCDTFNFTTSPVGTPMVTYVSEEAERIFYS